MDTKFKFHITVMCRRTLFLNFFHPVLAADHVKGGGEGTGKGAAGFGPQANTADPLLQLTPLPCLLTVKVDPYVLARKNFQNLLKISYKQHRH